MGGFVDPKKGTKSKTTRLLPSGLRTGK